jgi:hypothetical protein
MTNPFRGNEEPHPIMDYVYRLEGQVRYYQQARRKEFGVGFACGVVGMAALIVVWRVWVGL